ncbi:MAG: hypothetical protein HY812_10040 [Planctomycetes bacterium]|nr:hypothetical protein [Planctomycetota bacterium]
MSPSSAVLFIPWLGLLAAPSGASPEEFVAGHFLVADRGGNVVQEYNESYELVRTLGEGQAGFLEPWGLAFGLDGRLVIVASGSGDLFFVSGNGEIERQPNDGSLVSPRGVTVGAAGRLLVASRGNDSVVVFGASGSRESVIPCPAGLGQPSGIALDPAGRIWLCSAEAGAVYGLDDAGNVVGVPFALGVPSADVGFLGDWVMIMTVPSLDEVRGWNGLAGIGGGVTDLFPSPQGLCVAADRSYVLTLGGSNGLVRFPIGPVGAVQFGQGTLVDPGDVVTVPWRYRVKVRGRGYSSEAEEPSGKRGAKVLDNAILSLYPGSAQLMVEFHANGMLASADWLGQAGIVLQGGCQVSHWKISGSGAVAVKRAYREARLYPEEIQASVLINHTLPLSEKDPFASVVDDLGGRMIVSRMEHEKEVIVSARFLDAKVLNEP